jgi:O-antigen ligase
MDILIKRERSGFAHAVAGWSAVVLMFAAPVSRSLFIASGSLFALAWFAEGHYREKWAMLRNLPISGPIVLLSLMVAIWSAFSPAPPQDLMETLKVYSKLPLVLMLAATLSDGYWRQRAWQAFVMAMLLVVVSTYGNVVIDLPWSRTQNQGLGQDHSVFIEHVSQSIMTAIFITVCLHRALLARELRTRWLWFGLALISMVSMVLLLQGRSGLVALVIALGVFALMRAPRQKLVWMIGAASLLGTVLIVASPLMQQRLWLAYTDIANYRPFELTSLGARIDMWRFALNQSIEHIWLGTGAGTYPSLAAQHFGHCTWVCEHPHNQYLFLSMEFGVTGLLAFVWLLWRVFLTARHSTNAENVLLMAFLAVLAIDSLINVPLWFRGQSYFTYSMLALLIASAVANKPTLEMGPQRLGKNAS